MRDLAGKGALITGAASGIGRGMARAFAEAGMGLVLADLEADPLAEVAAELRDGGADVHVLTLDVTDRAAMMAAASHVAATLGKLHLLCNNAGVGGAARKLQDERAEDWDWVLSVNLTGVVNGLLAFLPLIKEHGEGGHVLNTGSMNGLRRRAGLQQGIYTASKFAVTGLSEALRQDLAPHGIGVSLLCPGPVNTRVGQSGRNRPARLGGPFTRPADHPLARPASGGLDADAVGRRARLGVETDEFYIITHPGGRDAVEARSDAVLAAFDHARALAFFD